MSLLSLTRRLGLTLVLALALFATPVASALARDQAAEAYVLQVGDDAVAILRDEGLAKPDKLAELKNLLDGRTDLDLVAKLIMGPSWRRATPEQQQAYLEAFRGLLNKTMADRMGDYSGQNFNVTGSTEINERDSMVQSEIPYAQDRPPAKVEWRVRKTDKGLKIIDIVAEGVSLVVSQRNEVASIVGNKGIDGLIETMQARAASDAPIKSVTPLEKG